MGKLRDKSQFYYAMGTMLEAGVSLLNAFRQPTPRRLQNFAYRTYNLLEHGANLEEAIRGAKELSSFEIAMLSVGQRSGCLPDAMKALSAWFSTQHALRQKLIAGLTYPLFCFHAAGPLLAVINHFASQAPVRDCVIFLAFWTLGPWILFLVCRILLGIVRRNALCGHILNLVPILGSLQFNLENATFFQALSMGLEAGLGISEAIRLAAQVCVNAAFRIRYLRLAETVERCGCRFHEAFAMNQSVREAASPLPSLLVSGEESGRLPESCQDISRLCQDGAARQLELLTKVLPAFLYIAVGLYLAYRIISFYAGYIGQINSLLN